MSAWVRFCGERRGEGLSVRVLVRRSWLSALVGVAGSLAVAAPAMAQDTVPPIAAPATFAATPNGNGNWRITAPQTVTLAATDNTSVAKFQYSMDAGANYVDVPVTA